MLLSSSSTAAPADPVRAAIQRAAETTGADFGYLLETARRESGFDPSARAESSSATGLFQFIDQTWMQMVKEAGPALGFGDYAEAIAKTADGAYVAADPGARRAILALRRDPDANAMMAGALAKQNRQRLADALGREPSQGELYVAHFLGAQGASGLIALAAQNPAASAADAFPRQAAANPAIFYDAGGKERSAGEVYRSLVGRFDGGGVPTPVASGEAADSVPADPGAWLAIPAHNAYAAEAQTAPFNGLFRTDARAPISNYVAATWTGLGPAVAAAAGTGTAAAPPAIALPGPSAQRPAPAPAPVAEAPQETGPAPADAGLLGPIGDFFANLLVQSQAAPLRDGKAWGG